MSNLQHFALLAPVPIEHLHSAMEIVAQGDYVAFGTRKWELFRKLDGMREPGDRVRALIYPSEEDVEVKLTFRVCWLGWYVGHIQTKSGAYPGDAKKHRPQSTEQYRGDRIGHWAAFWHVSDLHELPKKDQFPIGKIPRITGGLRANAAPRGPEIVGLPEALSHEP